MSIFANRGFVKLMTIEINEALKDKPLCELLDEIQKQDFKIQGEKIDDIREDYTNFIKFLKEDGEIIETIEDYRFVALSMLIIFSIDKYETKTGIKIEELHVIDDDDNELLFTLEPHGPIPLPYIV